MAGRTRTTKKLAQRINLDYFKTLHGIPRWRRILSGVFVIVGLGWLGWHAVAGSPKPYNAGPLGRAHALFGTKMRCLPCLAGQLSEERHRSGVPGMPRWPHPSGRPDVHAIVLQLPRGASRHFAPGQHQRSRLHAVPRRFERPRMGHRSSRRTLADSIAAIRNSRCCAGGYSDPGPSSSIIRCI